MWHLACRCWWITRGNNLVQWRGSRRGFRAGNGHLAIDGKTSKLSFVEDGLGYFAWCMVEDRDKNIWIGTRNMGLYRFDGKSFTRFSEQ